MEYIIVPITETHLDDFHAAVDAVAREKKYLAFLAAPPLAESRAFVRANIAAGDPQFVALVDGRVIGWSDILRDRIRPIVAHSGTFGIGLLRDYRGQGIGRALMARAIEAAWALGLTRIDLRVREANHSAIALYESFGFVREGLHRNAVRIDGVYENTLSMALLRAE